MPEPATMTRIQDVFRKQQQHRWVMARTTAAERCDRLRRLKEAVVAGRGELRQALAADFSKHAVEVELTEIQPTLGEISHTIRHLHGWMRPRRVRTPLLLAGTRSQIRYEPKGVALILAPWNYPFNLAVNPLVAAIAAGNCVMLRPSNKVPATAAFLKTLVERVFPEEEAAVFLGDHAVGTALLELPFDHIFFTGSTSVGRQDHGGCREAPGVRHARARREIPGRRGRDRGCPGRGPARDVGEVPQRRADVRGSRLRVRPRVAVRTPSSTRPERPSRSSTDVRTRRGPRHRTSAAWSIPPRAAG